MGRRFGRRKDPPPTKSPRNNPSGSSEDNNYVPPTLDDHHHRATSPDPPLGFDFVTQPPRPKQGLTGKISTLFRQKSQGSLQNSQHSGQERRERRKNSRFDDTASVSSRQSQKRIFYSSHQDDDSDDSYESRVSRSSHHRRARNDHDGDDDDGEDDYDDATVQAVVRYRGFSTSIKSLFLDEPLVCAAMGCFGLILSNRTEYLLQLRNERRGLLAGRKAKQQASSSATPSKIMAYALFLTLFLMFTTFLVWGFGNNRSMAAEYVNGYDYYDDAVSPYTDDGADGNDDGAEAFWDDYLQNNNQDAYQNGNHNYYNNNDDGNGDYYNNNYQQQNGYDYYDYNGGNRRGLSYLAKSQKMIRRHQTHPLLGICKVRDYQEHIWMPIMNAFAMEWQHEIQNEELIRQQQQHGRRVEDANNYYADDLYAKANDDQKGDDAYGGNDAGNNANYNGDDGNNNSGNDDGSAASFNNNEKNTSHHRRGRDTGAMIRLALLSTFLVFLAVMGRRRRMRTRYYLVRARAQEDHLYYASSDEAAMRRVHLDDTREDRYEGACSHTLFGCYPVDDVEENPEEQQVEVTDNGIFRRKKKPHHQDIIARGFDCLMASCCGFLCKCWCQCLSICALAQEAREIRLLIPPRYQRIDFITHQPFHEYQKEVNDLRRGWMGKGKRMSGIMPHYNALSHLSRYIVVTFTITFAAIVATLFLNPRAVFSWQDAMVLLVTFLQSFLVLSIVHGIFHKSDLSLDAVIKLFAAGFVIAVPSAFFFEGLIVNVMLLFSWMFYILVDFIIGDSFSTWIYSHWRLVWFIGELFNAYVVAAITEEICKYYTFRAVEHPDLVFITGLQREEQDESAVDGGLVKYPFASHQVQKYIRDDDASVASRASSSSRRSNSRSRRSRRGSEGLIRRTGTTDEEYDEDEADMRTFRQKAMAITTGMIGVAVGLACAENVLYVFVLGGATGGVSGDDGQRGSGLIDAWLVLFFRSLFPVHALSAAMQSINMIRKFVESENDNGHRIGIGRVILPAVLLHGTFDAFLLGINVYVESAWETYVDEGGSRSDSPPYNAFVLNLFAWIGISVIMVCGVLWYYRENRKQRLRLILLEEREKALVDVDGLSDSWNKNIPKAKSPSRISQLEYA